MHEALSVEFHSLYPPPFRKTGPTLKGRAHLWCQPLRKTWIFDFQLCFSVVKLSGNITKMVGNRFLNLETVKHSFFGDLNGFWEGFYPQNQVILWKFWDFENPG